MTKKIREFDEICLNFKSGFLKSLWGRLGFDGYIRLFGCMWRISGYLLNHPGTTLNADYGYAAAA